MPLAYRYGVPGEHLKPIQGESFSDQSGEGHPVDPRKQASAYPADLDWMVRNYTGEHYRNPYGERYALEEEQESPEPIRRSEFMTRAAYNPQVAFRTYPGFNDFGAAMLNPPRSGRGRDVEAFSAPIRGKFDRWTGLRRNISREFPQTFGQQTSQDAMESQLLYNDLSESGGY